MPRPLPAHVREATGGEAAAVREHILDAAYRVIAEKGLAAASTRAVAAEAEVAAGTLYNYFENRLQLLAQAMLRRMHVLPAPISDLPGRAGQGTVAANVRYFAVRASATLDELVPLMAAAFSDPQLLNAMRRELTMDQSPHGPVGILAAYLLAEQKLGRINGSADCRTAAGVIFGICHNHAFHSFFLGHPPRPDAVRRDVDLISHYLTK